MECISSKYDIEQGFMFDEQCYYMVILVLEKLAKIV